MRSFRPAGPPPSARPAAAPGLAATRAPGSRATTPAGLRPPGRRPHIAVIGEGVCSDRVARDAERVGAAIARAGAVLLCGGLRGVMEAASRGAARAGGTVVGLLPGFRAEDANPWVTIPIVTGMDQARNVILVRSADAVVAVGGMYGTLSEIALALKFDTPVVGLRTWRLAPPGRRRVPLLRAETAEEAVALALRAARRRSGGPATWLA